jgi:CRP-like cAMP-binding protein
MFDLFIRQINEKNDTPLTPEEEDAIKEKLTSKRLRKRQYLLQEGDVSRYMAFVEKGALRSFTVDEKATEHIIQFAFEGWIVADLYSFITGEKSNYNIEAIENSELLLITKPDLDELIKNIPRLLHYFYLLIQNAYVTLQQRIAGSMSLSIEENYTNLLNKYPEIIQRVPQHMIASYLGITPETLSRVKKQMSSPK